MSHMSQGPGCPLYCRHVRLAFPTLQGLRFSNPRIPIINCWRRWLPWRTARSCGRHGLHSSLPPILHPKQHHGMIPQKIKCGKNPDSSNHGFAKMVFCVLFFSYERGMGFMRFLANVMVKPFWDGVWINLGMVHLAATWRHRWKTTVAQCDPMGYLRFALVNLWIEKSQSISG